MDCIWIRFEDRFKCKNCGKLSKTNTLHAVCKSDVKIPNILQRAMNFAGAAINHVVTGLPQCTDNEVKERYNICTSNKCGFFNEEWSVCMHSKCGCFIRERGIFLDKLRWADSECPVGQWKSVNKDKNSV